MKLLVVLTFVASIGFQTYVVNHQINSFSNRIADRIDMIKEI